MSEEKFNKGISWCSDYDCDSLYQCFLLLDQFQDMMNKHLTYFEEKFKAELEKREEILNEKIKSLEDEVMRGKSRLSFIDLPCISSIK